MERQTIVGAADIGYGWTKVKAGSKDWSQPSVLGEARQLHDESIRDTDVRYSGGRGSYFVGDLALRHSQVRYAGTEDNKAETWTTKVLLETALGITAPQANIYLVTGLPVDYYFKQRGSFEKLLAEFNEGKPYEVTVGRGRIAARPWVLKNKIIPQPLGAAMNYLLDGHGNMAHPDDARKKILVIDVGYYTLDLLELDAMEIGPRSSSPEGLGADTAYKLIQEYLKDRLGKAPNRYDLDPCVRAGTYESYDITPLIKKAFEALGTQISMEVSSLNTSYNKYVITGGWASLVAGYLDIPKERAVVYDQLGNVQGYSKIGARAWGAV